MDPIVDEGISGGGSLAHEKWIAGTSSASPTSWWENTNWFRVQRPAPAVEDSKALAVNASSPSSSPRYRRFPSVRKSATPDTSSMDASAADIRRPIDVNPDVAVEYHGADSGSATASDASLGAGGANCFNRFRPQTTASSTETIETATATPVVSSASSSSSSAAKKGVRPAQRARLRIRCLQGFNDSVVSKINESIILPLFHRKIFASLGVRSGKGVVVSGSVGSGKSWLISALVNELGVYYHRVDCAALAVQMEQERAAAKIEDDQDNALSLLFKSCSKYAPAVLLLDDFDVIGHKPSASEKPTTTRIRSLLRTHMDRLSKSSAAVCVVATASSAALICPSLRRAGRFDREIALNKPDVKTRHELLKEMTKDMKLADDVNIKEVAERAHGYVAADLALLVTEAGMAAIRDFLKEQMGESVDAVESFEIPLHIAEDSLSLVRVSHHHFESALQQCRPNVLRGDDANIPKVSWADVGGQESLKVLLQESIKWPLQYPHIFRAFHLSPSTGILLYGPPGTGKTLIAQAVANEMKINFLSVKGPELLSSYIGESEANIRALFAKARASAPCVIFFDELDSIGRARAVGNHGTDATADRILNQLLTEMDTQLTVTGDDDTTKHETVETSTDGQKNTATTATHNKSKRKIGSSGDDRPLIFFIASTNRPDVLDPALIRPGRLDNLVYVGLPNSHERLLVLKSCVRNTALHSDVTENDFALLKELSLKTNMYSQADLSALVRTAAKLAIRQHIRRKEDTETKEEAHDSEQHLVSSAHFLEAMKTSRPSVRPEELVRFAAFQAGFAPRAAAQTPHALIEGSAQLTNAAKLESNVNEAGGDWRDRVRKEIALETKENNRQEQQEHKPQSDA